MRELTPTFEKYISVIAEREKSESQGLNTVLRILKNEIEPQLSRMTKSQLVEAFAEAIYAIYCTDSWVQIQEDSIEHYRREALRRKLSYGRLQAEFEKAPEVERKRLAKKAAVKSVELDPKQEILSRIVREALKDKDKFIKRGYATDFIREMMKKYPLIKDNQSIRKRLKELEKKGEIILWKPKRKPKNMNN
jgi:hypothetical protein